MNGDVGLEKILRELGKASEIEKQVFGKINAEYFCRVKDEVERYKKTLGIPLNGYNGFDACNYYVRLLDIQEKNLSQIKDSYYVVDVLKNIGDDTLSGLASLRSFAALMTSLFEESDMLKVIKRGFETANFETGINAIKSTLSSSGIIMPDLMFLREICLRYKTGDEIIFPKGFYTDMKKLNKKTINGISRNESILYRSDLREFVDTTSESTATVQEMNVIYGAKEVLSSIKAEAEALDAVEEVLSENELMDFMNFLDKTPTMAMNNDVGKKIHGIIKSFSEVMSFDRELYYHCRARKKDSAPYVWEQMKVAPYGITCSGRYNHQGQSFFYFADTREGAETEVKRHIGSEKDELALQTVEITAKKEAKLIDLAAKNRRGLTTFLKYIRFELGENSGNRPREYLIPSFVSDCCRECNFDGIKYYGGKNYSNYVTWSDEYYQFERMLS